MEGRSQDRCQRWHAKHSVASWDDRSTEASGVADSLSTAPCKGQRRGRFCFRARTHPDSRKAPGPRQGERRRSRSGYPARSGPHSPSFSTRSTRPRSPRIAGAATAWRCSVSASRNNVRSDGSTRAKRPSIAQGRHSPFEPHNVGYRGNYCARRVAREISRELFGHAYDAYASRTARLLPGVYWRGDPLSDLASNSPALGLAESHLLLAAGAAPKPLGFDSVPQRGPSRCGHYESRSSTSQRSPEVVLTLRRLRAHLVPRSMVLRTPISFTLITPFVAK